MAAAHSTENPLTRITPWLCFPASALHRSLLTHFLSQPFLRSLRAQRKMSPCSHRGPATSRKIHHAPASAEPLGREICWHRNQIPRTGCGSRQRIPAPGARQDPGHNHGFPVRLGRGRSPQPSPGASGCLEARNSGGDAGRCCRSFPPWAASGGAPGCAEGHRDELPTAHIAPEVRECPCFCPGNLGSPVAPAA